MAVNILLPTQNLSLQDAQSQKGTSTRAQFFKSNLNIANQLDPEKQLGINAMDALDKYATSLRQQKTDAVLMKAENTYKQELDNLTNNYKNLNGANAVDGYQAQVKQLDELKQKFNKTFKDSTLQTSFNTKIETYDLGARVESHNWHNKQVNEMYKNELQATADMAGENYIANLSSPMETRNKAVYEEALDKLIQYNGHARGSVSYIHEMQEAYNKSAGKMIQAQISVDPNMAMANLQRVKDKITPNTYVTLYGQAREASINRAIRDENRQLTRIRTQNAMLEKEERERKKKADEASKPLDASEQTQIFNDFAKTYDETVLPDQIKIIESHNAKIDQTIKQKEKDISKRAEELKQQYLLQYSDALIGTLTDTDNQRLTDEFTKKAQQELEDFKAQHPYMQKPTMQDRALYITRNGSKVIQDINRAKKLYTDEAFRMNSLVMFDVKSAISEGTGDYNNPESFLKDDTLTQVLNHFDGDRKKTFDFVRNIIDNSQPAYEYDQDRFKQLDESYVYQKWSTPHGRDELIMDYNLTPKSIAETDNKVKLMQDGNYNSESTKYSKMINNTYKTIVASTFDLKGSEVDKPENTIRVLFIKDVMREVVNRAISNLEKGEVLTQDKVIAQLFAYQQSSEFEERKEQVKKFTDTTKECVDEFGSEDYIINDTAEKRSDLYQWVEKIRYQYLKENNVAPSLEESIQLAIAEDQRRIPSKRMLRVEENK